MDTCTPGALQVADGSYYEPLNFMPEDVKASLIAHQLALKCRWNGNTNDLTPECEPVFYSVAQHSCIVHDIARDHKEVFVPGARWDLEPCPSFYGLMHDAGEGPYIDVPRPLKKVVPELAAFETPIINTILLNLGVPFSGIVRECVRRIDNAMIFWERDALVGTPVAPYGNEHTHPGGTLYDWVPDFEPWSPSRAKREFLDRFAVCFANAV
jgi:uncharacterized protein